jgi:hypothetical protein
MTFQQVPRQAPHGCFILDEQDGFMASCVGSF